MIYLDNAATTIIAPEVLDEMMPYLISEYGNAGAVYEFGRKAKNAIDEARQRVADLIHAKPEQIIFTSGGTEANNLAILGVREHLMKTGKNHIVTTPVEHESVLRSVKALCSTRSTDDTKPFFYSSYLPVDSCGRVSVNDLKNKLISNKDVGLVSIMGVNNELGGDNTLYSLGFACKKYSQDRDVLFHTDCVQAAGSLPLGVDEMLCDFMSVSSHKLHGPKGVGALFVRDKSILSPIICGGNAQEFGLRGGTENVAGIVGFGAACRLANINRQHSAEVCIENKTLFCEVLRDKLGDIRVNGVSPKEPGKILSLTFPGVDSETLVLIAGSKGVCISSGSACQSRESKPSHVLKAIGLSDDDARSTVRISFSMYDTKKAVREAAEIIAECVLKLRGIANED